MRILLANDDGVLPTPFREVVVTRRLSRSGESEYLLNGAACRLRDIHDLMRGTGLGADAGVVIEQRMIDALLSDRPDDRRELFEEAAIPWQEIAFRTIGMTLRHYFEDRKAGSFGFHARDLVYAQK